MLGASAGPPSRWDLAAEAIAVRIRWFGLVVGYLLVNLTGTQATLPLNLILTLGLAFTVVDSYVSWRGRIFLADYPLLISGMEALFIGLLCYFERGPDSNFRYYYLLSLVCCAIRHTSAVTYVTCAFHCVSFAALTLLDHHSVDSLTSFLLSLVIMVWVTWSSNALASLLKQAGEHLEELNKVLRQHQQELELKIAERTRQLQEAQANVLHQEKMAAFGLLAAGIAHEVGNPLTSISTIVQMLQLREVDAYTQNKLNLVSGQLLRIQNTLRELIEFSRPVSLQSGIVSLRDVLEEALSIAKYYKRSRARIELPTVPAQLPYFRGVRNQLVQVFLNLILNAMDSIEREGAISLSINVHSDIVRIEIKDTGSGISLALQSRLFEPYFTTKKQGTGLGLFVTRKLLTDHGGSIDFTSTPGHGTTFAVCLPIAIPAEIDRPEESIP